MRREARRHAEEFSLERSTDQLEEVYPRRCWSAAAPSAARPAPGGQAHARRAREPVLLPRLGGLERRIYHLARLQAAAGHRVTVVTGAVPGRPGRETMEGIDVVRLPVRRLPVRWDPPVQRTRGVRAALAELDPDVIDFHYRLSPEVTRATVVAAGRSGTPWSSPAQPVRRRPRRCCVPCRCSTTRGTAATTSRACWPRRIVCVSAFIEGQLTRHGFDAARLVTVPNGSGRPVPGGPSGSATTAAPFPPRRTPSGVGRLTPEKGVDLWRARAGEAVRAGADLRLVLCGRGAPRGPPAPPGHAPRRRRPPHPRRLGAEATKWRLLEGAAAYLHMARFESYGISIAAGRRRRRALRRGRRGRRARGRRRRGRAGAGRRRGRRGPRPGPPWRPTHPAGRRCAGSRWARAPALSWPQAARAMEPSTRGRGGRRRARSPAAAHAQQGGGGDEGHRRAEA